MVPLLLDVAGRRVVVDGEQPEARARLAAAGADVVDLPTDGYAGGAWLVVSDDPAVAVAAERERTWCVGASALLVALDAAELPVRARRERGGRVALVGGGPGDPGLITARGRWLLAEADVVVVDALAPRALLARLDPSVVVVEAGKEAGRHALPQEEIDALLVAEAQRGARVVRLKGGDPFLLGRGGEEALACVRAGVPWEVVPGVTSAVAVPAYAGIPVTHRGLAQEVSVVSAHLAPGDPASTVDWDALARSGSTLVLLMAAARLAAVADALVAGGRDPATPAAVVQWGTLPQQRSVTAPLGGLAAAAAAAGLGAPAVVVVGEVVALAEVLAWR